MKPVTSISQRYLVFPGVRCGAYHAGLRPAERERVLGNWTAGRLPAVAATVAFGMGIDRGGVALVAHYNLPKTLEGFYQVGGSSLWVGGSEMRFCCALRSTCGAILSNGDVVPLVLAALDLMLTTAPPC